MDYTLELKRCLLETKQTQTMELLSIMESESDFVLSCLESMSIVDGLDVLTEAKNGPGIWEKLKEFFKNLLGIFTSKVNKFTDRDSKWLIDNASKLKTVDVTGVSIEMLPYWNMNVSKIKNLTQNTIRQVFNDVKSAKRLAINVADKNEKTKELAKFDVLKKYDTGEGSTEGFKNFLRTGNSKGVKPVKLESGALKQQIPSFIEYCSRYKQEVVPFINSQVSYIDKEVKLIETKINSIKEHTLFIEDCNLLESDLRYCVGFDSLLEADNTPTDVKVENDKDKSPTDVKVENNKSEEKKDDNMNNAAKDDDYYGKSSKAELEYLKEGLNHSKLLLTSAMTVLEEKYVTYIKVLRGVLSNGEETDNDSIIKNTKENNKK